MHRRTFLADAGLGFPALALGAMLQRDAGATPTPPPPPPPPRLLARHSRDVVGGTRPYPKIFPLQVGFRRHGNLGIDVSDWFPHVAGVADELAFVRSMYTTDNDHGAEFQMHT